MKLFAVVALALSAAALSACTCAADSNLGGAAFNFGRPPALNAPAVAYAPALTTSVVQAAVAAPVCYVDEVTPPNYGVRYSRKIRTLEK